MQDNQGENIMLKVTSPKVRHWGLLQDRLIDKAKEIVAEAAADAERWARAGTPVKTGYARSRWLTTERIDGFFISNDAPYIEKLDAGSSAQAPAGITPGVRSRLKAKYSGRGGLLF